MICPVCLCARAAQQEKRLKDELRARDGTIADLRTKLTEATAMVTVKSGEVRRRGRGRAGGGGGGGAARECILSCACRRRRRPRSCGPLRGRRRRLRIRRA